MSVGHAWLHMASEQSATEYSVKGMQMYPKCSIDKNMNINTLQS